MVLAILARYGIPTLIEYSIHWLVALACMVLILVAYIELVQGKESYMTWSILSGIGLMLLVMSTIIKNRFPITKGAKFLNATMTTSL
jgi:hypothetical protein